MKLDENIWILMQKMKFAIRENFFCLFYKQISGYTKKIS